MLQFCGLFNPEDPEYGLRFIIGTVLVVVDDARDR